MTKIIFNDDVNPIETSNFVGMKSKGNGLRLGYDDDKKGQGFSITNSKVDIWINSKLTQMWTNTGGDNNMWVDRSLGHTVANYAPELELNESHFEKNNDFVFETIGPRSY